MRKILGVVALAGAVAMPAVRRVGAEGPRAAFEPAWRAVMGEWEGQGSGKPGEGGGRFSLGYDLQGQVLVRRNHSEYPAKGAAPAVAHDDLMVIYPVAGGSAHRAVYFDNEGHVIHYTAEWSADGKTLTFLSDPAPGAPRFRLVYGVSAPEELTVTFEAAPPGESRFSPYVTGKVRRVRAAP
jgi:hypothetical protein